MCLSVNNIAKTLKKNKSFNTEHTILYPPLKSNMKSSIYYGLGKIIFTCSRNNKCTKDKNTFPLNREKLKINKNSFLSISNLKNFFHNGFINGAISNSTKYQNLSRLIPNIFEEDLNRKIYVDDLMKSCYNITKLNPPKNMKKTQSFISEKTIFKNKKIFDVFKNENNFISYNGNSCKHFHKNKNNSVDIKYKSTFKNDKLNKTDKINLKKIIIKKNLDSIIKFDNNLEMKWDDNVFRNYKNFIYHSSNIDNLKKYSKKYADKCIGVDM